MTCFATTDDSNGNWSQKYIELRHTPEADLMARTGDIDNLSSGWPGGFDPFSGQSTPAPQYPWAFDQADPQGTDRMMAASGYYEHVSPVILNYNLTGMVIDSADLQIFIYGIQGSEFESRYQARLNGVRVATLEEAINSLNQTGPIGELISITIPEEYLYLLYGGNLSVEINDTDAVPGGGFAIDFVKVLINSGMICRTCCGCSAEINDFGWVGMDDDKVGREDDGSPDNASDGHFVLDLCLPSEMEVVSIAIYNTGSDGTVSDILPQHSSQVWHSADQYWDILGVCYRGRQLNSHHISTLGNFSCNVRFDLYGSDLGGFSSGNSYLVQVELGKLQKLTTI